jgi:hypothetical protein
MSKFISGKRIPEEIKQSLTAIETKRRILPLRTGDRVLAG